jgi:hypothetical protein
MKFPSGAWMAAAAVCLVLLLLPWTGSLLQAFSHNIGGSHDTNTTESASIAAGDSASVIAQVHQVGTPEYDSTTDTTSVTHTFAAPPEKRYRVEYQAGPIAAYVTLTDGEGRPKIFSSGPYGVFNVAFNEPGDRTQDWGAGMFFRITALEDSGAVYNLPTAPPHLMAHYLPWFEDGREGGAAAPWDHWRWSSERANHDPEVRRPDGLRDIAAAQYPLIGPYSSGDPAVVRYHCETAAAAGIEGLIVLWYGPGSPTDARVALILNEAERAGLKVALCYEEKLNWPPYRNPNTRADMVTSATGDLRHLLDNYASHPAYLRREGKPVVFQFNFWGTDRLGPRTFSPAEWEQILGTLGEDVSYVRQNFEADQHPRLAGSYHWWVIDQGVLQRHQEQVAAALAEERLVFHAGYIAPGFDDSGTDSWGSGNRRFQPREGTATLQSTFAPALTGDPEIVQIVTWNDFNEGTEVEPTVEEGFAMLDEIGRWWAEIKGRAFDGKGLRAALRQYLGGLSADRRNDTPEAAFQLGGMTK